MKHILKILTLVAISTCGLCMIDGMTYMDPMNFRKYQNKWPRGEDPCNPLYWYPRNIPEYCKFRNATFDFNGKMPPQPPLVPLPVPAPLPPPQPLLAPLLYPLPPPLPLPPSALSMPDEHQPPILPPPPPPPPPPPQMPMPLLQMPGPMAPIPSLPFGTPIFPTNPMVPSAGLPYPYLPPNYPMYNPPTQMGMVPGVPGMVSRDGGINIMPFSDVYSDLMEDHKWKMMRKHMSYCPLYRKHSRH